MGVAGCIYVCQDCVKRWVCDRMCILECVPAGVCIGQSMCRPRVYVFVRVVVYQSVRGFRICGFRVSVCFRCVSVSMFVSV